MNTTDVNSSLEAKESSDLPKKFESCEYTQSISDVLLWLQEANKLTSECTFDSNAHYDAKNENQFDDTSTQPSTPSPSILTSPLKTSMPSNPYRYDETQPATPYQHHASSKGLYYGSSRCANEKKSITSLNNTIQRMNADLMGCQSECAHPDSFCRNEEINARHLCMDGHDPDHHPAEYNHTNYDPKLQEYGRFDANQLDSCIKPNIRYKPPESGSKPYSAKSNYIYSKNHSSNEGHLDSLLSSLFPEPYTARDKSDPKYISSLIHNLTTRHTPEDSRHKRQPDERLEKPIVRMLMNRLAEQRQEEHPIDDAESSKKNFNQLVSLLLSMCNSVMRDPKKTNTNPKVKPLNPACFMDRSKQQPLKPDVYCQQPSSTEQTPDQLTYQLLFQLLGMALGSQESKQNLIQRLFCSKRPRTQDYHENLLHLLQQLLKSKQDPSTDHDPPSEYYTLPYSNVSNRQLNLTDLTRSLRDDGKYAFDAQLRTHRPLPQNDPLNKAGSRKTPTEYLCTYPGVSWNTRMQSWLVYYEDARGRKSRTFNPKRLTHSQLEALPPQIREKYATDPVEVAMHCACVYAAHVRWEGRLRKSLGFQGSRNQQTRSKLFQAVFEAQNNVAVESQTPMESMKDFRLPHMQQDSGPAMMSNERMMSLNDNLVNRQNLHSRMASTPAQSSPVMLLTSLALRRLNRDTQPLESNYCSNQSSLEQNLMNSQSFTESSNFSENIIALNTQLNGVSDLARGQGPSSREHVQDSHEVVKVSGEADLHDPDRLHLFPAAKSSESNESHADDSKCIKGESFQYDTDFSNSPSHSDKGSEVSTHNISSKIYTYDEEDSDDRKSSFTCDLDQEFHYKALEAASLKRLSKRRRFSRRLHDKLACKIPSS